MITLRMMIWRMILAADSSKTMSQARRHPLTPLVPVDEHRLRLVRNLLDPRLESDVSRVAPNRKLLSMSSKGVVEASRTRRVSIPSPTQVSDVPPEVAEMIRYSRSHR